MKKILLSGSIVLLSISVLGQGNTDLRLNLEKNKLYTLKSVSEQTVNQTINGNTQSVDTRVDYTLSIKMIDLTPEFMITEVHLDTIATKSNSMGKILNFSSANEGNLKSSETADVLSCIMNRLSKNALYVKMDFTGKPVEIVNLKMLSDLVLKDTSTITLNGMMKDAIRKQIENVVSDDNLKTMIGMFTWRLPGKQVATGDSWKLSEQMNSGGMMLSIGTTYHLDGLKGDMANLTAESEIKAADNAVPIKSAGATVTYDNLKGLSKSTMVLDIRTGLAVEENSKSHISGTLGISAAGMNMQMPMDINGETKIKAIQ